MRRRVCVVVAVLVGLWWLVAGIGLLLIPTLQSASCAGVVAQWPGDIVELAGSSPGWQGVPADHCVEISPNLPNRATDLGAAPAVHHEVASYAWPLWGFGMLLLVALVAALWRPHHGTTA